MISDARKVETSDVAGSLILRGNLGEGAHSWASVLSPRLSVWQNPSLLAGFARESCPATLENPRFLGLSPPKTSAGRLGTSLWLGLISGVMCRNDFPRASPHGVKPNER